MELTRLQQDLVGDGWTVLRHDVARNDSVPNIKAIIKTDYTADPANVKAVFLFGHVPVPYSGNICPDEHSPDHKGAWPADVYYGDVNGAWTDSSVNTTSAADSRNWNVPGDGKFDQSNIPSNVELMVGRVDLANMPGKLVWNGPATFPSEVELLRQYLNKDHNFRHVINYLPRRGLIYDGFGDYGGYAFAASSWRNMVPFFGLGANTYLTTAGTWLDTLHANGYEVTYGCGAGQYTGINGLGLRATGVSRRAIRQGHAHQVDDGVLIRPGQYLQYFLNGRPMPAAAADQLLSLPFICGAQPRATRTDASIC
jgi:hypothetical protein